VFTECGVAGAKVEDIARRAGVSKEEFYLYFDGENGVLKEIAEAWFARCTALFAGPAEYPDSPSDPDGLLDFCIERDVQLYSFMWQSRVTMRLLASCQEQEEYAFLFVAFREDIQRRHREWIQHLRRDGLFRGDVDVDLAATLVGGAYEDLALKMNRSERRPPFEKWLEFAQDTFIRAFGSPEIIASLDRRNRRATRAAVAERGRAFVAIGST